MTQNVQRWSQPVCTARKARVWSSTPSWGASGDVTACIARPKSPFDEGSAQGSAHVSGSVLRALPMTRATSAISANRSGSTCAAQPVTTISAPGFSRARRRIAWRACRVASAVTAHVLTMTRLSRPACAAARRIASDSTRFSRQPKVTSCMAGAGLERVTRRYPRKARDQAASRIRRRRGRSSPPCRRSRAIKYRGRRPAERPARSCL